jgi:hypothetical protein
MGRARRGKDAARLGDRRLARRLRARRQQARQRHRRQHPVGPRRQRVAIEPLGLVQSAAALRFARALDLVELWPPPSHDFRD